ncbi:Signal transduction histidine kinase [Geodermatophilus pulveris]|uniref:Oxygen sensor histidine kinase NreB n=1 Tax=Geodermatophilus pulveris TaxID=1564159 RepID=A0A239D687_9ACTN|nr:sensor histidine kinase [Geodermatophilus pulveris]SNS27797.1 Signal transduction histidine kinase [Geodermatophilus pulveris]
MIGRGRLTAAVLPARGGDGGGAPLSGRDWRATVLGMHLVSAAVWALAVVTALAGDIAPGGRAVVLGTLGVLAAGYAVAGAPAIAGEHPARAVGYLVVLVGCFAVLAWQAPSLLFLLFLAYPQVWFLVESPRPGVLWTVLLAAASLAGPLAAARDGGDARQALLSAGVGMVFSVALGIWVSRVLQQSRQRAELIEQLEATRAELAAAERERGVLAERERLAREVHDTLAQGYTSIVVLAQTAADRLDGDPAGARERLALIEEVARDNLAEARAVVAAFQPVALDDGTLVEALEQLAARFTRETGLPVRVDTAALGEGPPLRRDEEIVLLRGAQEALTNVRRHAGATDVVVRLAREAGQVSVHVVDDGVGFDVAAARGAGLDGLRGRVQQVGGAVDVSSAPGEGTSVVVRVPAP